MGVITRCKTTAGRRALTMPGPYVVVTSTSRNITSVNIDTCPGRAAIKVARGCLVPGKTNTGSLTGCYKTRVRIVSVNVSTSVD